MLLVLEVGNTNTKIGIYDGDRLRVSWRLTSRREQTADEYGLFIETLLRTRGLDPASVRGIAISNVVPPVQQTLESMCEKYFGLAPFTVEPGVNTPMPMEVDHPREVGADRITKSVAAAVLYGPPLIVVDLGTATTFDCVNADGVFIGGAIAPGLTISLEALSSRAASLFTVELTLPARAIGTNTIASMQSGLVLGYLAMLEGMIVRIRRELAADAPVIITGGYAEIFAGASPLIAHHDPDLTIYGLRLIYERVAADRT